jgi:hypothetical protein
MLEKDAMAFVTFEGTVEDGQIRLRENVQLPEHAKVYVVVPELEVARQLHLNSPRLANPDHADRYVKEVTAASADAEL